MLFVYLSRPVNELRLELSIDNFPHDLDVPLIWGVSQVSIHLIVHGTFLMPACPYFSLWAQSARHEVILVLSQFFEDPLVAFKAAILHQL